MAYIFAFILLLVPVALYFFICTILSSFIVTSIDELIDSEEEKGTPKAELTAMADIFCFIVRPFSLMKLIFITFTNFCFMNMEQNSEDNKNMPWLNEFSELIMCYYILNNPISFTVTVFFLGALYMAYLIIKTLFVAISVCFGGINQIRKFKQKSLSKAFWITLSNINPA